MEQFYDRTLKDKYLKSIEDNDILYRRSKMLFVQSYKMEHDLFKDVCEFNKSQILQLFKSLNQMKGTLINTRITLSKYIDFCISRNVISNNVADTITAKDLIPVANENASNVEYKFIYDIIQPGRNEITDKYLEDVRDRLVVYLIFLGVSGEKSNLLTNLKYKHVDFDRGVLRVSEIEYEHADIVVDGLCLSLIKEAMNTYDADQDDYIIRSIKPGRGTGQVSHPSVIAIIKGIKEYTGNKEWITYRGIEKAGMLFFGKLVMEQEGLNINSKNPTLTREVYDRFGINNYHRKHRVLQEIKSYLQEQNE